MAFVLLVLSTLPAQAGQIVEYTILLENGSVAGRQVIDRVARDRIEVFYDFKENGRGPTLREVIRLAPDGSLREFHVTGTGEMGGAIDEHFVRSGNVARWYSEAEQGRQRVRGRALYVPMDSSLAVNSLVITALGRSRSQHINLLPGGRLEQRVLDTVQVEREGIRQPVRLVMHTGVGLQPDFFWSTTGREPRLFAAIVPGYSMMIEAGWQASLPRLLDRQKQAVSRLLNTRARRLQHVIEGVLVVRNARVFDSEHAVLAGPEDVYVKADRILARLPAGSPGPRADSEIDGTGHVLLPGLFDMHAHLNRWSGAYDIATGVTTVRDLGNSNRELQQMIGEVAQGRLLGPRIVPAGLIEGKGEYATSDGIQVGNLDEARQAVDWYAAHGYRHLKIYNSLPREIVSDVVAHAHARGMTVGGHVPAFMTAREAVLAGFDELTHINQIMLNFLARPDTDTRTLERFYLPAEQAGALDTGSAEVRAFIQLLKSRGVRVDPTLAGFDFLKQRHGEMAEPFATIASHMPPAIARSFRVGAMTIPDEQTARRYRDSYAAMVAFVGQLYREGIPLVAGTDTFAGFGLHSELALYVKAGLTPAQALQVATWNGARYSGTLADRGSIEVGKFADLVLVAGDPTVDIEAIRQVAVVITRGRLIYPGDILQSIGVKPFVEQAPLVRASSPRKLARLSPPG